MAISMTSKLKKLTAVAIFTMYCLCFLPARADFYPYDWLITIETEEIANQFKYKDSKLTPVVKASVSYARSDGSDYACYETIWFCKGRAFGLERLAPLNIEQGQSVGVKVIHKTPNPTEYDCCSAALATLRLLLDVRINHSCLQSVTVPDNSYSSICSWLFTEHYQAFFAPLETPYQIAGGLFLQDESKRHHQLLCYAPNSPGY